MNAPRTPATRSPRRPRPCPSATRLARAPATRPTRTQMRIVSMSRRMSITAATPSRLTDSHRGSCGFGRQVLEHAAQDTVERWERMDDVGQDAKWGADFDGQQQLAED